MTSGRDIYATAKLFVRQHGERAALEAAAKADALLEAGDPEGSAVWGQVAKAINGLEKMAPSSGDRVQ